MKLDLRARISREQYMCYECAGDCFKKGIEKEGKVFCNEECYKKYLRSNTQTAK